MIRIENICTKKTYMKGAEEKTLWLTVGTFKTLDDGRRFIELNMFPETSFYIFEQKKQGEKKQESGKDKYGASLEIPF